MMRLVGSCIIRGFIPGRAGHDDCFCHGKWGRLPKIGEINML